MPEKHAADQAIYQLKVTLKDITPPIWRRLEVPSEITLYRLHQVLQIAFGWWDAHLHQFIAHGAYYGEPDPELEMDVVSERSTRLHSIARKVKDRFIYEYDFGDSWEHDLVLEAILTPEPGVKYPRCLAGKRHRPPEDVGGPRGYQEFLAAIRDQDHPEHEEYLEWAGGSFDPEAFDLAEVNRGLKRIR